MGLNAWKERQQAAGRVAEFVRLHPLLNPLPLSDAFDMFHFNRSTVMVDLAAGRDPRWKYYSDSTRNCLRKASRLLHIRRIRADESNLFQELYEAGLDRNDASDEYYFDDAFFHSLLACPWATAWVAFEGEAPVAVSCFLHANADISHYHLSGGNARARETNAHYLLLEVAFEHFAGLGVRFMLLGGGRSVKSDDALLKFKSKFSPLRMPFYVGGMIYDFGAYDRFGGGSQRFLCAGAGKPVGGRAVAPEPSACSLSSKNPINPVLRKESLSPLTKLERGLVLIGTGGHAGSLLATLKALGTRPVACIGPLRLPSPWSESVPWLGDDTALSSQKREQIYLINGIGSVGSLTLRRLIYERFVFDGYSFISVVHPSAMVEERVILGDGVQVMAGAILQTNVQIGANSIVNTGAILDHDCVVGEHVHVATGVRVSGNVKIGDSAHIGTGAVIIQGVTIGTNALVAAGAVVLKDVAPYQRVGGVPAQPLSGARRLDVTKAGRVVSGVSQ
jgi:UDP-perosamine 4-acetyltransferase